MDLVLKTERLVLRPLTVQDVDQVWPYQSNPELAEYQSYSAHKTKEETIKWLKQLKDEQELGKNITWGIFMNDQLCGVLSLITILRKHRALTYDRAELAYWLGPEFQGKGIMTEAGKRVIKFAFNQFSLHKLIVAHHEGNSGSENLIKRLGFKFSHEEKEEFMKSDKWVNCLHYELLVSDYLKNSLSND